MKHLLFLCFTLFLCIECVPDLFADSLYMREAFFHVPRHDGFFSFSLRDGKRRISFNLFKRGFRIKGRTSFNDSVEGAIHNGELGIFFASSYVELKKKTLRVYSKKLNPKRCRHSLSPTVRSISSAQERQTRVVDFILGLDRDTYSKISSLWVSALIERIKNSYAPLGININFIGSTLLSGSLSVGSVEEALESYRKNAQPMLHERGVDAMIVITSKELSPRGVLGFAFLGSACRYGGDFSIGVTTFSGKTFQPTLVAHELAHILNASHTSEGIMKAELVKPEKNFSQQSVLEISDYISESGGCLSNQDIKIQRMHRTQESQTLKVRGITSECMLQFYALQNNNKLDRIERRRVLLRKTVKKDGMYTVNNIGKISHFCE